MSDKLTLPRWHGELQQTRSSRSRCWLTTIVILILVLLPEYWLLRQPERAAGTIEGDSKHFYHNSGLPLQDVPTRLRPFQDCSIDNILATNLSFLSTASPLSASEFVSRRDRLAEALVKDGLDAFLVEPGHTFQYYANVTQQDWEPWEPEERPFVMIIQPALHTNKSSGDVDNDSETIIRANTTFLVPSFEAERAKLLQMPLEGDIHVVTYEEHWNPYSTLLSSPIFASYDKEKLKIMVDEEMRDFISRGLFENGFDVVGLGGEVEQVRQTKSEAEIGILRAVNTGTVESLRAMRACLEPTLSEDDVMMVLDNTMRAAGLNPFFDIVLFDENAANPHGGTDGNKRLEEETMVLIDVGAHLYGYSSDVCRSFFPPFFKKPVFDEEFAALSSEVKQKIDVWNIVFEGQSASLDAMHENRSCAAVDIAARGIIEKAGYGAGFTHQVGHGIGIKAHESPYLNKGNVDTLLKAGMTFTSEPGIYLMDEFGVRHEDVLLVREEGPPDILSGERAKSPWEP